jgi:hypothetical protein
MAPGIPLAAFGRQMPFYELAKRRRGHDRRNFSVSAVASATSSGGPKLDTPHALNTSQHKNCDTSKSVPSNDLETRPMPSRDAHKSPPWCSLVRAMPCRMHGTYGKGKAVVVDPPTALPFAAANILDRPGRWKAALRHASGIPSSPNFGDALSDFGPGSQQLTQPYLSAA